MICLDIDIRGNADELNRRFLSEIDAPVCIAGKVSQQVSNGWMN